MDEKKSLQSQYLTKMFQRRGQIQIRSVSFVIVILEYSRHVTALISQSDVIITPHWVNAPP